MKSQVVLIRQRLKEDFGPCLNVASPESGYFSSLLVLLTTMESCAQLLYGDSERGVGARFVREYLGKVCSTYAKIPGLLYVIFRHGLAHEGQPRVLELRDKKKIGWTLAKGKPESRGQHLKIIPFNKVEGWDVLYLDLEQFYDDLQNALTLMERTILDSEGLTESFAKRVKFFWLPKTEAAILSKYSYVPKGEFDYIREQLAETSGDDGKIVPGTEKTS